MPDFDAQYEAFGASLEHELRCEKLNFPTVLDLSLRIQRIADDPDASLDDIAAIARAEPVLSAKAVRLANSLPLNPYGTPVTHVGDAIRRIGLDALRSLAFAVAAEQLTRDLRPGQLKLMASGLWMHTVDSASWAQVIARSGRGLHPDAAMFAGMMVDIGQFFLLARAAEYPALTQDLERFTDFVTRWHEPVGHAVLKVFALPDFILAAYRPIPTQALQWPPTELADILQLAALLTEAPNPFEGRPRSLISPTLPEQLDGKALQDMLRAVKDERRQLLAALCN